MNLHSRCLRTACDELEIAYRAVGDTGVFLEVELLPGREPLRFIATETPFNNHIHHRISKDKFFSYELLKNVVRMPRTRSFIDPNIDEEFAAYAEHDSVDAIAAEIETAFEYPIIVKANSGSQGDHVYRCEQRAEVLTAAKRIFSKDPQYDHVLLAQECVAWQREFRATVFDGEILLAYEKDISQAQFTDNLSPLHWEGARAVLVEDEAVLERLQEFVSPVFEKFGMRYAGLDIILDEDGELWLLELNAHPAYNYLVQSTSERVLVDLYKALLTQETMHLQGD